MTTGHPLASLLLSLRREGLLAEVTLDPLDAAETAYLAAHLAGEHLDQESITALYQETEGNPLFVVETVRAGVTKKVQTGQLSLQEAFTRPGALLPPTVQAVISSRLAQLSPAASEAMGVAAVIGRAFTFDVLARASSMDEDTLVLGLDELWQRRIVREQGSDAYDFSHDKLREQAYASLSALALVYRKLGRLEDARRAASRALSMATAAYQPVFVCLNKANLAWVAWREGKLSEAWALDRAALEEWQSLPTANYAYYSRWTALLPVIDMALLQDQLSEAVASARMLLAPEQQILPGALTATLEAAIRAWDTNQPEMARICLGQTITLAQEIGYL